MRKESGTEEETQSLHEARDPNKLELPNYCLKITRDGRSEEQFCLFDSGKTSKKAKGEKARMLIFGTEDNVERLKKVKKVFSDGTFSPPDPFDQIYVIHGEILRVSLNFCLIYFDQLDELKKGFFCTKDHPKPQKTQKSLKLFPFVRGEKNEKKPQGF